MFELEHLWILIRDYWNVFLIEGLSYTLVLSAIAVLVGSVFGALLAFGRLSKSKILHFICTAYTEIIRDTPLLVQLYFFVLIVPKMLSGIISISTFQAVALAFALNSAAYVSEIFRSGIQAVDVGQTEAARSLGMNAKQTMLHVVMPQAIKNILPALGNEFVSVIKETSMASTFFVGDLMTSYLKVKSDTYWALEALLIVAAIYFVLGFGLSKLIGTFERRLNSK